MNQRYGNERDRHGEFGPLQRAEGERDQDEERGSEWQRGRERRQGSFDQGTIEQRAASRPGWYSRGHTGTYGGGGGGGYRGGYEGGGYGGSSGTDYSGSTYGAGRQAQDGSPGHSGPAYGSPSAGYSGGGRGFGGARSGPQTAQRGGFAGRGPKGYKRTDERIREEVCDRLSSDDEVDASEIEVGVEAGEVTLVGSVPTRSMKHRAEDVADVVAGVSDVHNQLRVDKSLLTEIKDKLAGEDEQHFSGGGTKNAPYANGTLPAHGRY